MQGFTPKGYGYEKIFFGASYLIFFTKIPCFLTFGCASVPRTPLGYRGTQAKAITFGKGEGYVTSLYLSYPFCLRLYSFGVIAYAYTYFPIPSPKGTFSSPKAITLSPVTCVTPLFTLSGYVRRKSKIRHVPFAFGNRR